MTLWDDNMQIECANSLIKPLELNVLYLFSEYDLQLIDKKNKQKILKIAIDIVSNDVNAENEKVFIISYLRYSFMIPGLRYLT